jgi:uncharacterized protein (DUF983 family)
LSNAAETPVVWPSAAPVAADAAAMPSATTALLRGAAGRCPCCNRGKLFDGWLKQAETCRVCAAPVGRIRADDAPPYFTIFAVGHVVIPGMLVLEKSHAPELWVHTAIWVPLTIALSLALMRPVKGATIGLMLKLGFGRGGDDS